MNTALLADLPASNLRPLTTPPVGYQDRAWSWPLRTNALRFLLALVALVLALPSNAQLLYGAAWPKYQGNNGNTGQGMGYGAIPAILWQVPGPVTAPLVIGPGTHADDAVYVATGTPGVTGSAALSSIDGLLGNANWSIALPQIANSCPAVGSPIPGYAGGVLYVPDGNTVSLVNPSTGAGLNSNLYLANGTASSIAVGFNGAYFGSSGAPNSENGQFESTFANFNNLDDFFQSAIDGSSPAIGPDGSVYFAAPFPLEGATPDSGINQAFLSYNGSTGLLNWSFLTYQDGFGAPTCTPSVGPVDTDAAGIVYCCTAGTASQPGDVLAIDGSGIIWKDSLSNATHATPAIGGLGIYVAAANGWVYDLVPTNGWVGWSYQTAYRGTMVPTSPPVIDADENVYIAGLDGVVYAFGGYSGNLIWSCPVDTADAVADGGVNMYLAIGSTGILYCGAPNGVTAFSSTFGFNVSPGSAAGGVTETGTISLNGLAPGGAVVNLSSSNPNVVVPSTLTIPSTARSGTFTFTPAASTQDYFVQLSGSFAGQVEYVGFELVAGVTGLSLSPNAVLAGSPSTGTVTMAYAEPYAVTVNLSSNSSTAIVPSTVTVPAGATSEQFAITTLTSNSPFTAVITASYAGSAQSASLAVATTETIASVSLSPTTVNGGSPSTGTVVLGVAAPSSGVVVNLASSNPNNISVPASVTVPAGATSGTFTVTTLASFHSSYTGTITASIGASSKSAVLTVTDDSVTSLSLSPSTVTGGISSTGTVTLAYAAPPGGFTFNLASNKPTYVGVPSTVTVPAGATSTTFTVTANPYTVAYTASISASYLGTVEASTTVTVAEPSLTLSPTSVAGGTSSTGTVTLPCAAPSGGFTLNLVSNKPNYVGVPSTVTVLSGNTSATFTVTTAAYSSTYSATITGSYSGVNEASATITVTDAAIASLTVSPSTVSGGTSSTGTLTLSTAAPAGGFKVNLSSSTPSYVGVPSTLTIPAGARSAAFTVTTKPYAYTYTATITASYLGAQTRSAKLTVTP